MFVLPSQRPFCFSKQRFHLISVQAVTLLARLESSPQCGVVLGKMEERLTALSYRSLEGVYLVNWRAIFPYLATTTWEFFLAVKRAMDPMDPGELMHNRGGRKPGCRLWRLQCVVVHRVIGRSLTHRVDWHTCEKEAFKPELTPLNERVEPLLTTLLDSQAEEDPAEGMFTQNMLELHFIATQAWEQEPWRNPVKLPVNAVE